MSINFEMKSHFQPGTFHLENVVMGRFDKCEFFFFRKVLKWELCQIRLFPANSLGFKESEFSNKNCFVEKLSTNSTERKKTQAVRSSGTEVAIHSPSSLSYRSVWSDCWGIWTRWEGRAGAQNSAS